VGKGYEKLVLIVSRASGAPVIANALVFAAELVKNKVFAKVEAEYAAAEKAGLNDIIAAMEAKKAAAAGPKEEVVAPPAEPVPAGILGVDVMDLDDAAQALWKAGMYAETGMGCTGPVILVSDANEAKARDVLKDAGYLS
jgi:hypothetical protein